MPARSRKRLEWSARAGRDLFDAWAYITADSFAAADAVEQRIVAAAERLLRYPALGRRGRIAGTRELPVARTSFTIIYRVSRRGLYDLQRIIRRAAAARGPCRETRK